MFFSGFFIFGLGEVFFVNCGLWKYANPDFMGIPLWMPLSWGFIVILINRFSETLDYILILIMKGSK